MQGPKLWFCLIVCASPICTRKHFACHKQVLGVCGCLSFLRSGYSLAGGVFPICWKGLNSLLGCSTDLLNSCVQGPCAKTPPTTVRRGVAGICTYPILSCAEAPLMNKGDQVETYPLTPILQTRTPLAYTHTPTGMHKHPSTNWHGKFVLTLQFKACVLVCYCLAGGFMG